MTLHVFFGRSKNEKYINCYHCVLIKHNQKIYFEKTDFVGFDNFNYSCRTLHRHMLLFFNFVPHCTATDRITDRSEKIVQNQRKTSFFIKMFGVFNANSSDSVKRTVN